jgi:chromosome segregation ATPase
MNNLETYIKTVNEKLQQLLKNHAVIKKENDHLKEEVKKLTQKEENYKTKLYELDEKVNILKASSGEMTEADKKEFEKRINQYIKEIDKCIGLLSE